MATMRVSLLRGVHDVVVEERDIPTPQPDEVLVKVGSVGVCGSDVHYYEQGRIGRYVVDSPLILGHEAGGTVVEVGSHVTGLSEGQRVALEPGVPCRSCRQCLSGHYNLCPDMKFFATPPYDGAFAEFVVMPADFVYPIPDHVSDDAAALLEPLSVGIWACRQSRVTVGDSVLITGAGPIGLACAQSARAFGADSVTVSDLNPHRLALAAKLGFETINVAEASGIDAEVHADVLLECSGNQHATWDGINVVARAGRVVLVGMGGDEVVLPMPILQERELTVTSAFRYANTWPTAIQLAASGRVDLDALVTGHYGLSEVEAALTASARDQSAVKVIVRPADQ